MMDLRLQDRDIEFHNGDLVLCDDDTEAIAQALSIRLKTLKGEWFLDTSLGVPYLTEILGHKHNIAFLRNLFLPQIESLADIKAVKDFNVEVDTERKAHIKFSVVLTDLRIINVSEKAEV